MKILICLFMLYLVSGCNIFKVRNAEPPEKPPDWNRFPNTPELCVENLLLAFNHQGNVYFYGSILSDAFVFNFDPNDVQDFTVPERWYKQNEVNMLMNVYYTDDVIVDLKLNLYTLPNQPDIIQSNNAWIYREYNLVLNHTQPNLGNEFVGNLQLFLERKNDGLWVIREWHDYRVHSEWTFGRMKNAYGT